MIRDLYGLVNSFPFQKTISFLRKVLSLGGGRGHTKSLDVDSNYCINPPSYFLASQGAIIQGFGIKFPEKYKDSDISVVYTLVYVFQDPILRFCAYS